MTKTFKLSLTILLFFSSMVCVSAQSIETQIDSILSARFSPNNPGLTALVAKSGNILYRKSIGLANVELGLKMNPDQVFRIGSITKQFTAAAILKLAEADKLTLADDIRKYVPDFISSEQPITIQHLLSHTSGIKNYTQIQHWDQSVKQSDLSPLSIIAIFKQEPLAFQPGEQFLYSNLGYILLGYIIEQTSGIPYAEYLRSTFFEPLGMTQTSYDQTNSIVTGRIPGYSKRNGEYSNAAYQDMKLPYAAGGLISSVDDIKKWHDHVFGKQLLKAGYLASAHRPFVLNNGQLAPYGYGWQIGRIQHEKSVKHDGVINGFITFALYLPQQEIFVALFSNCDCTRDIEEPASEIAALIMDNPFRSDRIANLSIETLKRYQGVYESPEGQKKQLTVQNEQLMYHDIGGGKTPLIHVGKEKFKLGQSLSYLTFSSDQQGQNQTFTLNSLGLPEKWVKTSSEVVELQSITMADSDVEKFLGKYDFPGAFTFEIVRIDDKIFGKVGNDKQEILPYHQHGFFALNIDAKLIFDLDPSGKVQGIKLVQSREMQGTKMD